MSKRGWEVWATALIALWSGEALAADTDPSQTPPGAVKKTPANAQSVVPISQFMETPEFPFTPKPKVSIWKRLGRALRNPFAKDPELMELPPGTVPTPGALPVIGPRPAPELKR